MKKTILRITVALTIAIVALPGLLLAQPILCPGDTLCLTVNGFTSGNIQWQESPNGSNFTPIIGATTDTSCIIVSDTAYYRAEITEGTCDTIYSDTTLVYVISGADTFYYSGVIDNFVVPPCAGTLITIEAYGAQGASVSVNCVHTGGLGARMRGNFAVTTGETIKILVGQQGISNNSDGGGGGGSFVVRQNDTPMLIAGGGGGATNNIGSCGNGQLDGIDADTLTSGTASGNNLVAGGVNGNGGNASTGSGCGGGGFFTDGLGGNTNGRGKSYLNGGAGGTGLNNNHGGFGGGGCGWHTGGNGGGGGGYSGGGTSGSNPYTAGGGGGSYNVGTNQSNSVGVQSGNGMVIISW